MFPRGSGLARTLLQWSIVFGLLCGRSSGADDAGEELFEREIRPLLVEKCSECHTGSKSSGGLNLESRQGLLEGGDSGPSLDLDRPEASLLLRAVRRSDDLAMPPEDSLSPREIAAVESWVKLGAPWTKTSRILSPAEQRAKDHWAFQPALDPATPAVRDRAWVENPIDAFVLARLEGAGLTPSAPADRRTLARRLSYTLTGLPPAPKRTDDFIADADPESYERFVDELLASPQYGERWTRHWLDVARYSDTKGYVYAREERFWVHAWSYRDWVVSSLNGDLPYDRFLKLQIAADQIPDRTDEDLAAMGFLTLGRRFLGVPWDIVDDRIDTVSRGTMGLTVACARCHDHKYDPIPTADYYSLYGVFASSEEQLVRARTAPASKEYEAELAKRQQALSEKLRTSRKESSDRARSRVRDYLQAQLELDKYPAQGFDQIFETTDLLPAYVRRLQAWLHRSQRTGEPVFAAWHRYRELPAEQFAAESERVTAQIGELPEAELNPLVRQAFQTPPASFSEVVDRYADILTRVDKRWRGQVAAATDAGEALALLDTAAEQVRQVLYGPTAPFEAPDQPVVQSETFFDSGTLTELWRLQSEVDRWIIHSPEAIAHAVILRDSEAAFEPRILRRGNPVNYGDDVPRQFLKLLSGPDRQPFQHGSGRLELAEAIASPRNPLTARVLVNRVWMHHFGEGLVTTPSDFGLRADPPSHPELLDWLAIWFVNEGWSLKKLHRLILTSNAWRQSSLIDADSASHRRAVQLDPENRLLWRANRRRLSFEEIRDSLLASAGELDLTAGGKPTNLFAAPFPKRRSLYGLVDRQFLPGTLRMFDFANPDLHIPQRSETTVPQQALFLLNNPLTLERAQSLARVSMNSDDPTRTVTQLFERTLQREPTSAELADALAFVASSSDPEAPVARPTSSDWQYGFGRFDEEQRRTADFTPLPHFTGTAWQGGAVVPDPSLGWAFLTATGGHPGNDRAHAAIRRWTAPRAMTIRIDSKLINEPAAGDGVRAFVVSSRSGLLQAAKSRQELVDVNVAELQVEAGETLDFVVDIDEVLDSDQFLWEIDVQESAGGTRWNSKLDFPHRETSQLTEWERLAQALLCSNEFLFVD